MLEEVIDQIKDATAGMLVEDIEPQLEQCANVAPEDVPRLAAFIASLNA
jgi:hypothetical protein